jgi:hypothetical protein
MPTLTKTERKVVTPKDIKLDIDGEGTFQAVFATMNVIDKDGDLTEPGAFGTQQVLISQYNHGSWGDGADALPIGVGTIYEKDEEAVVQGEFDMSDEAAVKTYNKIKYLKEKGRTQEWSYALPEVDWETREIDGQRIRVLKKIKVPEVSPVIMGAGENTRLLDIKQKKPELKKVIPSHSTDTVERDWDGPQAVANARNDEDYSYYRRIFAWMDAEGDESNKSSYKFPHHEVSSDGDPGAANIKACIAGIAALNGARGGADIPDGDRQGVWDHLAKHMRDADEEPPELEKGMRFSEHATRVLADVEDVVKRFREISELRRMQGKSVSKKSTDMMLKLREDLRPVMTELEEIYASTSEEDSDYLFLKSLQEKIKE